MPLSINDKTLKNSYSRLVIPSNIFLHILQTLILSNTSGRKQNHYEKNVTALSITSLSTPLFESLLFGFAIFVEAVLYRYRAGIPWRDLPERFGAWKVIHTRFSRWATKGVWVVIFEQLSALSNNEYAMIDSTIVRAHQHSSGAKKKKATMKPLDGARVG
jgi:transposase